LSVALKDYASENEEEYYGQGFEKESVVSVWVGLDDDSNDIEGLDVLQDSCGVGYYDLDNQEGNCFDFNLTPVSDLLIDLSYSESFIKNVNDRLLEKSISKARWVIVQYDFAYDPNRVTRGIAKDPIFLGVFNYTVSSNELSDIWGQCKN